jgi:CRISPR type III-associated protein (TIGR04423 family)
MQIDNKTKIIEYINTLQGYEGYTQFSHRPIDQDKDIFYEGKYPKVEDEAGFIFEAHFCNGIKSISIRQINDSWLVSKTDISNIVDEDIQDYISDIEGFNYKIKMAQIWEKKPDDLCANMEVKKLTKVVFAGFEGEMK